MDNEAKQNLMIDLYKSAIDNEDYNAAQTLRLQIDTLQNTILQERTAALNTAQQMAENGYKEVKSFVSDIKSGDAPIMGGVSLNYVNQLYKEVGPGGMQPALEELGRRLGIPTPSYIDIAAYYADQALANMQVAAQNLTGSDAAAVQNDIAAIMNGSKKFDLPGLAGDKGITYDDLQRAREAQINGSSPIIASQNAADGKPGFIRAKLSSWNAVTDAAGNVVIIPNYEQPEYKANQTSNLPSTDSQGRTQVEAIVNGVKQSGKYYRDKQGNVVDEKGKGVKLANATFNDVYMAPNDALQARGFRVNADGTVDFPNGDPSIPADLQGFKTNQYKVDHHGNLQYTYETKDANGQIQRELFTYDVRNNRFASAAQDALTAASDRQIFQQQFKGNGLLQGSGIGDVLQTGDNTRKTLQAAEAEKARVAAAAASQQTLQQSNPGNVLNLGVPQGFQLQVKNPLPTTTRPLSVVNAPAPTQPLTVQNTPSNASVKVYNAPITQGLQVQVQQPKYVPTKSISNYNQLTF